MNYMSCLDIIFHLQSSISHLSYKPFQHNQTCFAPQHKQSYWFWFFLKGFISWTSTRINETKTASVCLNLVNQILILLKWIYDRSNSLEGHSLQLMKTSASEIKERLGWGSWWPSEIRKLWDTVFQYEFGLDYFGCSHGYWWKKFPTALYIPGLIYLILFLISLKLDCLSC